MRRKRKTADEPVVSGYDYSTREAREVTVSELFHRARNARTAVEAEWQRYNDYYNGVHDVTVPRWCRNAAVARGATGCRPSPA